MSARSLLRLLLARTSAGAALARIPGLSAAYGRSAFRRTDHGGLQVGVFATYPEAAAAIPAARRAGWDNAEASALWTDRIDPVQPSGYPVFFWLRQFLTTGSRLLDIGGSIGLTYYGYRRLAGLPAGIRWQVVEVPAIAAAGRTVAAREAAAGLDFVDALADAGPADILLAAGSLQYMEDAVPGLLERLPSPPAQVLVNKVALTEGGSFWTLQNFGPAVVPYRVWNRAEFLGYFASSGYRLRDAWEVAELSLDIPFEPRHSVPALSGFCFERESSTRNSG
jgi:putative methyltransferase (TIGR04325 family)